MSKHIELRVRLTEKQQRRLKWASEQQERPMSQIIRELIATLPEPPEDWKEDSGDRDSDS